MVNINIDNIKSVYFVGAGGIQDERTRTLFPL